MDSSLFLALPGTLSHAVVSLTLVFSFSWVWGALVCPLSMPQLPTLDMWLAGQTASEWWSWELIGRESLSSDCPKNLTERDT